MKRIGSEDAKRLLDEGAQAVEVLPQADHRRERLPGAVSLPLARLTRESTADLDPSRPLVVYCYDTQCDLSGRAAARLAHLGFADVYDYTGSKAAWLAMGWPSEGTTHDSQRAGAHAKPAATCRPGTALTDLPAAGPGGVVLVVDDDEIVLGSIDPATLTDTGAALCAFEVAYPGPSSVRPSITVEKLARSMDKAGETWVAVTTLEGALMGIVERNALRVDR